MVQFLHQKKRGKNEPIRGDKKSTSNQDPKSQRQNPRGDQRPQFVRYEIDRSSNSGRGGSIKNDRSKVFRLIFLLARTPYNLAKDYTTVGDIPTKLRLVGISGVLAGG